MKEERKGENRKGDVIPIPELVGFVGSETGSAWALSADGMEVFFVSWENQPLRWINIAEFIADPKERPLPRGEEDGPEEEPED